MFKTRVVNKKEKILEYLNSASLLAEELDDEFVSDSNFNKLFDKSIADLINKLSNRLKLSPQDFELIPNSYQIQLSLNSISDQLICYSDLNFETNLKLGDQEPEYVRSLASAVHMMGEELHSKVLELKEKNEELLLLSKAMDLKNKLLSDSLSEKEVLIQEVHHRVKNNLQIISGLVQLKINRTDSVEVFQLLTDIVHRIKAMAMVHEKLYQTQNLSFVDLCEYTEMVVKLYSTLYQSKHKIEFQNSIKEKKKFPIKHAISYGLMLNEIISNSFKHAFNSIENGIVEVRLEDVEGIVKLVIQDNGIGMESVSNEEFSSSIGLKLIRSFSSQLGTEAVYENAKGVKVSIYLNFD